MRQERGDHDFCLSRSQYTDTNPISRERAATAGIEPKTSSPGVARSTDRATASPCRRQLSKPKDKDLNRVKVRIQKYYNSEFTADMVVSSHNTIIMMEAVLLQE